MAFTLAFTSADYGRVSQTARRSRRLRTSTENNPLHARSKLSSAETGHGRVCAVYKLYCTRVGGRTYEALGGLQRSRSYAPSRTSPTDSPTLSISITIARTKRASTTQDARRGTREGASARARGDCAGRERRETLRRAHIRTRIEASSGLKLQDSRARV